MGGQSFPRPGCPRGCPTLSVAKANLQLKLSASIQSHYSAKFHMQFPILHDGAEHIKSPKTQQGIDLMESSSDVKEYREGIDLIRMGASDGCPHAHYIMGNIYMHELADTGVFISVSKAKTHFQAAAEQGHPYGKSAHEKYGKGLSCTALICILVVVGVVIYLIVKAMF